MGVNESSDERKRKKFVCEKQSKERELRNVIAPRSVSIKYYYYTSLTWYVYKSRAKSVIRLHVRFTIRRDATVGQLIRYLRGWNSLRNVVIEDSCVRCIHVFSPSFAPLNIFTLVNSAGFSLRLLGKVHHLAREKSRCERNDEIPLIHFPLKNNSSVGHPTHRP